MFAAVLHSMVLSTALMGQQGPVQQPFPAHRVLGNLYYVGSRDIAIFLVTTDKGHFLINSGFETTVPLIQQSVSKLGFKMSDVKVILASHAHSDHVAGHALLKKITAAKVVVMQGDEKVISEGGKGQYLYTKSRWKPCKVDRVLKDKEKVKLGKTTLIARKTPGHTPGCTTWAWAITQGKKKYNVVIIGSPNVNPGYQLVKNKTYPQIASDFVQTFKVLKGLKCDLFLGAHGAYYGLDEKYPKLKKGKANPFIDPQGYRKYVELKENAFRRTQRLQLGK
jgi:metallo-beta-lactamase class B